MNGYPVLGSGLSNGLSPLGACILRSYSERTAGVMGALMVCMLVLMQPQHSFGIRKICPPYSQQTTQRECDWIIRGI